MMNARSDLLSQRLAAQTSDLSVGTPCAAQPRRFAYFEARLTHALAQKSGAQIRAAATPMVQMCAQCSIASRRNCLDIALITEFTGVAGGLVVHKGAVKRDMSPGVAA